MDKVLLFNPPGDKLFIRDYYCSKVSKADYLPQPVDLVMQSGFFRDAGVELQVIDAIAENLSPEGARQRIIDFAPTITITQCGSVSWPQDSMFFRDLKKHLPKTPILASGDLFLEDPPRFLEDHPWLDGIITDFFLGGSYYYLRQEYDRIQGMVYRQGGQLRLGTSNGARISPPRPMHDKFKNHLYRYPFATGYPMATVLTNYACPYPCTFCIMSTLEFKSRSASDVIQELDDLHRLGVKYIYFSDQTFYLNPKITEPILEYLTNLEPGFEWVCFSRVDVMSRDRLEKMKAAGCNVIMFGVEWAEEAYLRRYKKEYSIDQIKETFQDAQKVGIKRMGTFLIGVPGQNRQSIENTVNFAIELDADYASFNIAVPRANTSFRAEAIDQHLIDKSDRIMDQSGSFIAMGTGVLTTEEVMQLKKMAYRRFYFRPRYLWQRLKSLTNLTELTTHIREGYQVLRHVTS